MMGRVSQRMLSEPNTTFITLLADMTDGNIGAMSALGAILQAGGGIGAFVHVLKLDDEGIYGPRIWMLFKDVYHQDATRMLDRIRTNRFKDDIMQKTSADAQFRMEWDYYGRR